MGLRGPITQPAAIAKEKGLYRPSRHEDDISNKAVNSEVFVTEDKKISPPKHLDKAAKAIWRYQMKYAATLPGYISLLDIPLFTQYCVLYGEITYFNENKPGRITTNFSGTPMINPEFTLYLKCLAEFRAICREFGFTPSARVKLPLVEVEEGVDEFAEFA